MNKEKLDRMSTSYPSSSGNRDASCLYPWLSACRVSCMHPLLQLQMLCRDSWASHLYSSIPTNQQFIVASTNRFLVISAFVNCFLEIPQKSINRATNSIFFNPRRSHQEIFLFSQKIMSQVTQKCAHYAPGVQTKTFGFACSSSNHSTSKIVVSIRLIHSPHIHYSAF